MITDLPYSPSLYDRSSLRVITTTDPNFILRRRYNRVYLLISWDVPIVAVNPAFLLEQVGEGQARMNASSTGTFELWWDVHNIITTLSVFASGFGIGTIFNVTEVWYNPLSPKEYKRATRVFETTESKVKRSISERRGISGSSNGRLTPQSK